MTDVKSSDELLAAGGPIDRQWPEFVAREGQQQMAIRVQQSIDDQVSLLVEAPSGSGKTLAYLVPIVMTAQRAIISTASRYLQSQLFKHDLPLIQGLLGSHRKVALLQGRSNYLCPYYLDKNTLRLRSEQESSGGYDRQSYQQLTRLSQRFRNTGIGELSLLAPELAPSLLPHVTSSRDDCLSTQCPDFSRCPLMAARQQAEGADIVIVNHSLLFSDQVMRKEQLGSLLPSAGVVVVDEAHRISDFAQTIVGLRLSSGTLKSLCRDVSRAIQVGAPEQRLILSRLEKLQSGLFKLDAHIPSAKPYHRQQHVDVINQLSIALRQLRRDLNIVKQRDHSFVQLEIRTGLIVDRLNEIVSYKGLCWVQGRENGFVIQTIPLTISLLIKELFQQSPCSWIFTSATLTVNSSPDRFKRVLGLDTVNFYQASSDIDFQRQAMLYTPKIPVDPRKDEFYDYYVEQLLPLLAAAKGRVLCLFSSYRGLNATASRLRRKGKAVLIQRSPRDPRRVDNYKLVAQLKNQPQGILLATGSFWEGVDLSGFPLSAVAIDKLPFAHRDDPLIQLRSQELSEHGVDSFSEYLLPDAIVRLRQGCGRLLRRVSDRGVIMIADPRLQSQAYGQDFMASLPSMRRAVTVSEIESFFSESKSE